MKVELRQAFAWTCDECGIDNFCNAVSAKLTEEEIADLRQDFPGEFEESFKDPENWEIDGEWVTLPKKVICKECKTVFETFYYGDE